MDRRSAAARANVIALSEIDPGMHDLVGGKAAGLAELIAAGERVPAGFCLTTEALADGELPEGELAEAYAALGGGPVAVRSSATAEDLAEASFAGQQDTYLDVRGAEDLLRAVRDCRDSLFTDRAVAYRAANGIAEDDVRMAVVVQRMISPRAAGVLFTANPLTGCRTEVVVDAVAGLGTAVVDGSANPEHHVLDGSAPETSGGCLTGADLSALRAAAARIERHFGSPQDVEWAIDSDGELWLLQSRAITTLFPMPPDNGRPAPRAYFEFGNMQGLLRPCTPMGMSAIKVACALYFGMFGRTGDPVDGTPGFVDIGGRLYGDLTGMIRSRWTRGRLPESMSIYGPRMAEMTERLLADPRFAAQPGLPFRPTLRGIVKFKTRVLLPALVGIPRAFARPASARERAFAATERLRASAIAPAGMTAAERLRFAEQVQRHFMVGRDVDGLMWPLFAGILAGTLPSALLKGVASEAELNTVLGGLPHNVTTQMDLGLWRLAEGIDERHRELFAETPAEELTAMYREGALPEIGLAEFLAAYGHRAAAEVDIGVPRWGEDPTPVFTTIANYLRITDPEMSPQRRFERAAADAEAKLEELVRRARRTRPIRGRLAEFAMRRSRELTGLRELGKFGWLHVLASMREQLLLVGAELAERGLLERAEDVVFLDLREARAAVAGADQRELVVQRRRTHQRELRRTRVPMVVLSDGTDLEAAAPPPAAEPGALLGMGAAPGEVTGRARVVRDPVGARLEPGEILVAPTTDPGWTPLFMTAGGLVTETGSPVAHGPTVAREYGLPAVICVRDATTEIRTGQLISVDGATGVVRLVEE
ncbi:PEP/pyruvate-binding domain-containing protein [Saccharopolyspora griseoalba]|uniref:PEP/pyruvate-binding domain-containing protein n=1 Tax=Saccharopolyspora griseoalba TaxID=1431848 RepID=A0ABW2LK28_9PSEU